MIPYLKSVNVERDRRGYTLLELCREKKFDKEPAGSVQTCPEHVLCGFFWKVIMI